MSKELVSMLFSYRTKNYPS